MTTKEEKACCFAFAKRKIAEDARKNAEDLKEAARKEAEEAIKAAYEKAGKVKIEMVDAMITKSKLTDEEIYIISGIPQEKIEKRRAQLKNEK